MLFNKIGDFTISLKQHPAGNDGLVGGGSYGGTITTKNFNSYKWYLNPNNLGGVNLGSFITSPDNSNFFASSASAQDGSGEGYILISKNTITPKGWTNDTYNIFPNNVGSYDFTVKGTNNLALQYGGYEYLTPFTENSIYYVPKVLAKGLNNKSNYCNILATDSFIDVSSSLGTFSESIWTYPTNSYSIGLSEFELYTFYSQNGISLSALTAGSTYFIYNVLQSSVVELTTPSVFTNPNFRLNGWPYTWLISATGTPVSYYLATLSGTTVTASSAITLSNSTDNTLLNNNISKIFYGLSIIPGTLLMYNEGDVFLLFSNGYYAKLLFEAGDSYSTSLLGISSDYIMPTLYDALGNIYYCGIGPNSVSSTDGFMISMGNITNVLAKNLINIGTQNNFYFCD